MKKFPLGEKYKNLVNVVKLSQRVDESIRFFVSQVLRRSGYSSYKLRGSDVKVYLRHGTDDLAPFTQIFLEGHYAFLPQHHELLTANKQKQLKFVDLGGNIGFFCAKLLSLFPSAQLITFEPDAKSLAVLKRFVAGNSVHSIMLVDACAANTDGFTSFLEGQDGVSRIPGDRDASALNEQVTTVKKVDVFRYLEGVDFLKIDIEGGEWAILQDPRFEKLDVPLLAIEYHKNLCPAEDPERFARERLEKIGYHVLAEDFNAPEDHGVFWATKQR